MLRFALGAVLFSALAAATAAPAASVTFNDPYRTQQWYLGTMNIDDAWGRISALPQRGAISVAVVDSGFQSNHPDFVGQLVGGINIVNQSSDISAIHPHGTGTAGLIGARSGNGTGISQAAWGSQVQPIRVTNSTSGSASLSALASGIRYAADHGARVINVSYGGVETSVLNDAARYAYQKGALTFMAAGNDGQRHATWTNHPYLIAVGATNQSGTRTSFSSYGGYVDFAAPGENILSLYTGSTYRTWAGTSFSSPLAASVAALVLTVNPRLSPAQVLDIMKSTAVDLGSKGKDEYYGYGRPDALAAVERALVTSGTWTGANVAYQATRPRLSWRAASSLSLEGLRMVDQQAFLMDVPEPASVLLLIVGWLWCLRRRSLA